MNLIVSDWFLLFVVLCLVMLYLLCLGIETSVLTLMSGHAIGAQIAKKRLNNMINFFVLGSGITTWLLIASTCFVVFFCLVLPKSDFGLTMLILIFLLLAQILVLFLNLLRKKDGTQTWLNKHLRHFLHQRATKTKSPAEAFSLGVTSPIIALPLTVLPITILSFIVLTSPIFLEFSVSLSVLFAILINTPLILIRKLIFHNKSVVEMQRFIITNRRFFQSMALLCLLILSWILVSQLGLII